MTAITTPLDGFILGICTSTTVMFLGLIVKEYVDSKIREVKREAEGC